MKATIRLAMVGLLLLSACETTRATKYDTPKERVTECEKVCNDLGMKLGALVIIMSSAGCVCEPKDAPASSERKAGAGAAAGGVSIAIAAAAAAQVAAAAMQQQPMHR